MTDPKEVAGPGALILDDTELGELVRESAGELLIRSDAASTQRSASFVVALGGEFAVAAMQSDGGDWTVEKVNRVDSISWLLGRLRIRRGESLLPCGAQINADELDLAVSRGGDNLEQALSILIACGLDEPDACDLLSSHASRISTGGLVVASSESVDGTTRPVDGLLSWVARPTGGLWMVLHSSAEPVRIWRGNPDLLGVEIASLLLSAGATDARRFRIPTAAR